MNELTRLARRQILLGWTGLFLFLLLGLILESLHGFKVSWYLAADNETRRFLWVLAHAHGALLSLVNVLYGLMLTRISQSHSWYGWISLSLLAALILMPTGFLAGGVVIYQGDPGPGIVLALVGAACLIIGVGALVLRLYRDQSWPAAS